MVRAKWKWVLAVKGWKYCLTWGMWSVCGFSPAWSYGLPRTDTTGNWLLLLRVQSSPLGCPSLTVFLALCPQCCTWDGVIASLALPWFSLLDSGMEDPKWSSHSCLPKVLQVGEFSWKLWVVCCSRVDKVWPVWKADGLSIKKGREWMNPNHSLPASYDAMCNLLFNQRLRWCLGKALPTFFVPTEGTRPQGQA